MGKFYCVGCDNVKSGKGHIIKSIGGRKLNKPMRICNVCKARQLKGNL